MKKEQFHRYRIIKPESLPVIATSFEPKDARRLPIGKKIQLLPDMVEVPRSENNPYAWPAVVAKVEDDYILISPRTMCGIGYIDNKPQRVVDTKLPKKALIDFLKDSPTVIVSSYEEVEVDAYGQEGKTIKGYPIFNLNTNSK